MVRPSCSHTSPPCTAASNGLIRTKRESRVTNPTATIDFASNLSMTVSASLVARSVERTHQSTTVRPGLSVVGSPSSLGATVAIGVGMEDRPRPFNFTA